MAEANKNKEEYSIIVYLIIFFAIISLIGFIRLLIILNSDGLKDKVDLAYIDLAKYEVSENTESVNLSIKNILEKHYDIDIYYGENTKAMAKSVNATELLDKQETFYMLKGIYASLLKYPKNMISEMKSRGYKVSIYLVDYFNNSIVALANRNSNNEFNIYISSTNDFERTLHHETYHVLDYYIKLEKEDQSFYAKWNKYNPKGFQYTERVEEITSRYIYTKGKSGSYFVTAYAKYAEKEDRAETFAQMMMDMQKEIYYNEGESIRGKINIITKALRETFVTVNNSQGIYWERYL